MGRSSIRAAAPAIVLSTLVLLPFLGKAFTTDDTLFLKQAEHALIDPLHPTAFEAVWAEKPERMSQIMPSGPVMAYLLVPCVKFGAAEWVPHTEQLVFLGLALLATAALALRLGLGPFAATAASLLLGATPTALALAGTAMPDVPAMALGVAGVERLLAWRDERRIADAVISTVAFSLATLARSHLVLLLVAAALLLPGEYPTLPRLRSVPWLAFVPLVLTPLLVAAVVLVTRDPQAPATALVDATRTFSSFRNLRGNLVAFATHWSLVLPFACPWLALRPRAILRRPFLYVAAVAAGIAILLQETGQRQLFIALPAALGAAAIYDVIAEGWRKKDGIAIALGLWLLAALPAALYIHMPSKYLLASAPAAALLVARELAGRSPAFRRRLLAATTAVGLVLGLLILRADARFAGLGRRAAAEIIRPRVAAGRTVWFSGHWGFQWYAEKAGGRCLTVPPPHPVLGDLVVTSARSTGLTPKAVLHRKPILTLQDRVPGGRIMSRDHGAGFYSNGWGYLPWVWGDDLLDRFDLWQVE